MEPVAPGTEDEPPVSFSSTTKQEKERERLLSVKAVLQGGRYGNVFDLKYINGAEHWYCNACACPVMGWIFHHETGKRHKMSLGNQTQDRHLNQAESDVPLIQIAPGEPLPPGFEGQVEKIAAIQERLDVFNVGPLVALEYLLELSDYDLTKEPSYLCILCDKKGDPRTVLTHLASYKHISQYLQKHFPTCYRALAPYMTKQYKRNWQTALHGIAEAIEKKFGRLKPMPVEASKFEADQVYYLEVIAKGRHFSELSGYTFEEMVNKDVLTKVHDDEDVNLLSKRKKSPSPPVVANPIKKIKTQVNQNAGGSSTSRRRSLSSVSSITSSDLSDYDEPKARKYTKSPPPRSRSPFNRRYERRPSPVARRPEYYRKEERRSSRDRHLLPWERPNYRRTRADSEDTKAKYKAEKLDEYQKLAKAIENDHERILKNHKKNPEKHPHYNDEWKKFWNKRYKELQAESKDVSKHDFKPEWIEFWNKRMIDLHNDEVKAKKEALRKRIGLPEEPAPISFKIGGKRKFEPHKASPTGTGDNKPIPPAALPDHDPEVIVIEDRDDESKGSIRSRSPWEDEPPRTRERDYKSRTRSPVRTRDRYCSRRSRSRSESRERDYKKWEYGRHRERIRVVSELPWERERSKYHDYYKPPPVMRDVTREPVLSPGSVPKTKSVPEDDGDINVIAILRLLTALEEKLGSLGPKVIDLLAKALAMEKTEANSSETLLDNEVNCVLFETVKEKLKGQLLAGLVEPIQEKAFKNAIRKTASLIHLSGERKKERDLTLAAVDPVKVPGIGTVDKAAIARQIANALVLQGKTDVTQAELEQLINAVVGMAEASKMSKKPMTTANFLEQIASTNQSDIKVAGGSSEKTPPPPCKVESPVLVTEVCEQPKVLDRPNPSNMEGLSDSDLQTLLQNFKDLSTEEQHGLINYLKKLEAHEPDRVERLRKFVNLGGNQSKVPPVQVSKNHPPPPPPVIKKDEPDRKSPFSNRLGGVNPTADDKKDPRGMSIDSDEDDYTFDDVVKAASLKVKEKEMEKEREIAEGIKKLDSTKLKEDSLDFDKTKALINNIMGGINRQDQTTSNSPGGGSHTTVTSADLAKTLNLNNIPVNLANLANIVAAANKPTGAFSSLPPQQPIIGGLRINPLFQQQIRTNNFDLNKSNITTSSTTSSSSATYNYSQSFYQQPQAQQMMQTQQRQNVSYPIDKSKATAYPNYGIYDQERYVGGGANNRQGVDSTARSNQYPPPAPNNINNDNSSSTSNNRGNYRW